jgi:predicted DNA-binding transcriptional regulator YafY
MQELLPEEVKVSPESLDAYLSLDLGPLTTPDAAVFREILTAQRQRRRALVRYRSLSSNRTTNRRIHPYHVFNLRGNCYVAAWDEDRQAVRDFALPRMRRVTITTESYEVPRGFRKYMADSFGIEKGGRPVEVAIRFASTQARCQKTTARRGWVNGEAARADLRHERSLPVRLRRSLRAVRSLPRQWFRRAACHRLR